MKAKVLINGEESIQLAVDASVQISNHAGFSSLDTTLIASSVSESCSNVVKYADRGELLISYNEIFEILEVTCTDEGPGIANIDKYKRDGKTTSSSSLGIGLGAIQRAMNSVVIESDIGLGTRVKMSKWKPFIHDFCEYGISQKTPNFKHFKQIIFELSPKEMVFGSLSSPELASLSAVTERIKDKIQSSTDKTPRFINSLCLEETRNLGGESPLDFGLVIIKNKILDFLSKKDFKLSVLHKKKESYVPLRELKNGEVLDFSEIDSPAFIIHNSDRTLDFEISDFENYHPQIVAEVINDKLTSKDSNDVSSFLIKPKRK
jgi:serine/threonine-protein kinase RsbT